VLAEVQRSDKTRSRDSSYRERASKNARWHGTLCWRRRRSARRRHLAARRERRAREFDMTTSPRGEAPAAAAAAAPAAAHFASVCVYCGSSAGDRPEFADAARSLGAELASRGSRLVYGGGSVGLMGAVSTTAHANGGRVLGVIPVALEPVEVSGGSVGEVMVVEDMHERKAAMAAASDAFIAMPGGFGTLEELLEMITWQQLGYHAKPVGVLNVAGYFDLFLKFLDESTARGFIRREARAIVVVGDTPAELLDKLETYAPPRSLIESLAKENGGGGGDAKK